MRTVRLAARKHARTRAHAHGPSCCSAPSAHGTSGHSAHDRPSPRGPYGGEEGVDGSAVRDEPLQPPHAAHQAHRAAARPLAVRKVGHVRVRQPLNAPPLRSRRLGPLLAFGRRGSGLQRLWHVTRDGRVLAVVVAVRLLGLVEEHCAALAVPRGPLLLLRAQERHDLQLAEVLRAGHGAVSCGIGERYGHGHAKTWLRNGGGEARRALLCACWATRLHTAPARRRHEPLQKPHTGLTCGEPAIEAGAVEEQHADDIAVPQA